MARTLRSRKSPFLLTATILVSACGWISAKPGFSELQFNPHWYRTFDSTSDIIPEKGQLLFNWRYADAEKKPDSFFVGIDTLWALPQDLNADTAQDWDLQVCPNGYCVGGLKGGVHGADAPDLFGDTSFATEHHFQFFPSVSSATFRFTGTHGDLFGGLMFCRSRSTGIADTVFGFGSWGLVWDSLSPPPVRPVAGYLPKLSDFSISGDTVRYLRTGSGIRDGRRGGGGEKHTWSLQPTSDGVLFSLPVTKAEKILTIYGLDGKRLWVSEAIPGVQVGYLWNPDGPAGRGRTQVVLCRLTCKGYEGWEKAALFP